jgi:hypothetical protein
MGILPVLVFLGCSLRAPRLPDLRTSQGVHHVAFVAGGGCVAQVGRRVRGSGEDPQRRQEEQDANEQGQILDHRAPATESANNTSCPFWVLRGTRLR